MASSIVILFSVIAATVVFSSHHSHAADKALLDKICRQTRGYDFCINTFIHDERTPAVDINGLIAISISNSQSQGEATLDSIKKIESDLTDPVDKQRIGVCKADYTEAVEKFKEAFGSAVNRKDYADVVEKVRDGGNKVIDCEDIYRRSEPIRQSPFSGDNHRMVDLVEITFIAVDVSRMG